MYPHLTLFGFTVNTYGICAAVGMLLMVGCVFYLSKKRSLSSYDLSITLAVIFAGVMIGAHLLYGITNISRLVRAFQSGNITSFSAFWQVIKAAFGGMVFYGGLIGGLFAGYLTLKKLKQDVAAYSDVIIPGLPLFHVFGRIGCFLGGCCYGTECSVGFVYTMSPDPAANGVVRFPIQLVEAGFNLLLFLLLAFFCLRGILRGKLLYVYLLIYPVGRFIFEFFRGDVIRGNLFGLSTSQWISILLFLFAAAALFFKRRKEAA